jgi:S1-C subfamily serine protease
MTRSSRCSVVRATLAATLAAAAAAAPAAGQRAMATQVANTAVTPRQIAASARAALLMIRALGERGDTLGLGTGFVVSPDGMFVTNFHVVQEAAQLRVKVVEGGAEYAQVSLIAADPAHDLALMKLPAQNLRSLKLGSDTRLDVGDRVFVMGNPLGMAGTFSDGMVSATRPLEGVNMLQITAPISPGSSGGPVMDERGEVVAVATMMVMGGENLNMAVPVRYLQPMVAQRAEPRPFGPGLLATNVHAGLALVGDGDTPMEHEAGPRGTPRRQSARSPQGEVVEQVSMIAPLLSMRGFVPAFPTLLGQAAQSASDSREVPLEKGVRYIITARCDADCHDVDLTLTDAQGKAVQSDADGDAFPTIGFVPEQTGVYRVGVRMSQCSDDPCVFGVAVFRQQPTAAAPRQPASSR